MDGRLLKFVLIVGGQNVGKSTFIDEIITNIKTFRPVLNILADDEEEIFWKYKEIKKEHVHKHLKGVRNVFIDDAIELDEIRYNRETGKGFRNGAVNFDDASAYLGSRNKAFRRFVGRRRQGNNDFTLTAHAFDEVPPSISKYFTDLILFSSNDDHTRWTIDNPKKYLPFVQRVNEIALAIKNPHYREHYKMANGSIFDPQTGKKLA